MAFLRILKEGETNINSTEIWRFAYHSDYPTLKIKTSGKQNAVMTAGTHQKSITIAHNLGYEPNFFVNIKYRGKLYESYGETQCSLDYEVPTTIPGGGGAYSDTAYSYSSVDSNNLYVEIRLLWDGNNVTNNETFEVYYFIQLDEE